MIVPMKKVTVLCLASAREATLEHLRELGVLHLEHVKPPENDAVEAARKDLAYYRRALEVLPARAKAAPSGRPPAEIVRAIWDRIHERQQLEERLEGLRHERLRVAPFGDFDPAATRALEAKGLRVRLYQAEPKSEPVAPPGTVLRVLSRSKEAVYFAVIGPADAPTPAGTEVRLPEIGLSEMDRRIAEAEASLERNRHALEEFAGDRAVVAAQAAEAEDRLTLLQAAAGMGAAERVAWLRGYCPEDSAACIRQAAAQGGWGVLIETPRDDDPVPTLIRNPRWVRPIQAVFKLVGILPGYREIDISAVFLLFFSLFFAMLVGDAGYGFLFLGLTLWARPRLRRSSPSAVALLLIMSVCTIVWGALTGTWFGVTWRPIVPALTRNETVMALCFLIGAVQLSIAHVWNIVRQRRSTQALAQLGWLAITWVMYFAANAMVLNRPFPRPMLGALAGGVALIALFMTPVRQLKTEWFNHVMLPLNLVSSFVDIVSYIRLFAVGTATVSVAQAFNGIALGGGGPIGLGRGLAAALILFLGHALNVVLAGMGVIVHGVRLNTLEFSGHLGMQWTGLPYRPFARATAEGEAEAAE